MALPKLDPRRRAWLALALLVPAPTISVVAMLFAMPGPAGKAVAGCCKLWMALLPAVWTWRVEGRPLAFPRPSKAGMPAAILSGMAIFAVMLGVFELVQPWISAEQLAAARARAHETGLDQPLMFIAIMLYITLVNSLLEEYAWRWFCFRQCEAALGEGMSAQRRGPLAVALAGGLFTVHHVFALAAWVDWRLNLVGSVGVFIGGATWSALYLRYRSIWPGFVSHVFADAALFVMGWRLLVA